MAISNLGIELIKKWEGFRSKPYLCSANVPTIGYGSTFYEDNKKVTLKDSPITEPRAVELLKFTVEKVFEPIVNKYIKANINQNQLDALISFVYNLGPNGLWDIKNKKPRTITTLINNNQFELAANEFGKWVRAGGKVLPGLVNRRKDEQNLFLYGKF